MDALATKIAKGLLQLGAINIRPQEPYRWASGWQSPMYCDNRKLLGDIALRADVADAFAHTIRTQHPHAEAIAGVATGAIAMAAWVAERLQLPLAYVRSAPKAHGLGQQVEGADVAGKQIVVIEDLISTGGSSHAAALALQQAGATVLALHAIFSYGFPVSGKLFSEAGIPLHYLCNLEIVLTAAVDQGQISEGQLDSLRRFQSSPESWKP